MTSTRRTLLTRVKDPADREAWDEFYELYAPLLYRYARGLGLTRDDADEVRDRCLEIVARRIRHFEYDRSRGRFKGWLHRIARDAVVDLKRTRRGREVGGESLAELVDGGPGPDEAWEERWRRQHLLYCVERVQEKVPPTAYRAFCMLLFDQASVPEVCEHLGLNANQVYKAKGQVLRELRAMLRRLGTE